MAFDPNNFHFIRPEFLLLFIPVILLIFKLNKNTQQKSAWQNVISPHLLEFLFIRGDNKKSQTPTWLLAIILSLLILAISGPSVRQKSVPVMQTEQAQVILLDLSLSMDATDIKPSRLERAKFKLLDLLNNTKEGTIGLVVYAGDAFVISPLTSDAKTVTNMVPVLSTSVMPVLGSRPDIAIQKSIDLLSNAKYSQGQIIWLTDGVENKYVKTISEKINDSPYKLSILAIGTKQGAPIPLPDKSGFLKDKTGSIVVPKLQLKQLNQIAEDTQAGIIRLTADNSDLDYLNNLTQWQKEQNGFNSDSEHSINRWIDDGYWLLWLAIIFFIVKLFKAPSNSLTGTFSILAFCFLMTNQNAQALEWKDLWQTKKQQADKAFENKKFGEASELYEDKNWKAAAQYRNGQFADAANNFDPTSSVDAHYNYATSLAKGENLKEALASYEELLKKVPDHEDALFNKKIIEDLLKEQQKQQQDNQQQKDSDEKNNENQEQQNQQQDSKDAQQNEEQQDNQQQNTEESSQEPKEEKAKQQPVEITEDDREKSEKDQALEHWLEKIPDDPGGLLRRKMYREYQRRGRQQKEEILW